MKKRKNNSSKRKEKHWELTILLTLSSSQYFPSHVYYSSLRISFLHGWVCKMQTVDHPAGWKDVSVGSRVLCLCVCGRGRMHRDTGQLADSHPGAPQRFTEKQKTHVKLAVIQIYYLRGRILGLVNCISTIWSKGRKAIERILSFLDDCFMS